MRIRSTAFEHNQPIPARYTCEGEDVSPPLIFEEVPAKAKSLVLIVDDPDAPDPKAPQRTWVHWVLYNLPPDLTGLDEATATPPRAAVGLNDWQRNDWGGPCPPIGRHRYFFKLYALDTVIDEREGLTKLDITEAMIDHVIAQAELVGTYSRSGD
ncbi:MAG TPA: YbhB/YbcL family Raf kinase inhibitor-like protein [Thioalkalivibrio sp.]|nr:YbhB/YbcL family Raf kinase inhibitor-like protein [Thioalkalivibrio sp.]